jgi:hypothetical protein
MISKTDAMLFAVCGYFHTLSRHYISHLKARIGWR